MKKKTKQNKTKKESKTKQQQQQKALVQIHSLSLREVLPELIAKATCKRTQLHLPTLLGQQCWEWSCCVRVGSDVQTDVATPNNTQQSVQWDATCSIQQRWELLRPFET